MRIAQPTMQREFAATLRSFAIVSALSLFAVPAFAQAPGGAQSKCIQLMNKLGSVVAATQLKAGGVCLKNAAAGKLDRLGTPPQDQTAQACLNNDVGGRIAKVADKLAAVDAASCLATAEQTPDWGYTGATQTETAATGESLDLLAALFGSDLDTALIDPGVDKTGARCQAKLLATTGKLYSVLFKTAVGAKSRHLKCSLPSPSRKCADAGMLPVTSAAELATAVFGSVDADAKGKIAKTAGKLAQVAGKICNPILTPLTQAFPGECAGSLDAVELAACAESIARRHFCLALRSFDDLIWDCGTVTAVFLSPSTKEMLTRQNDTLAVTLDSEAPPGGLTVDLSSDNPGLLSVQANATVASGETDAAAAVASGSSAGTTTVHASAAGIGGDQAEVTVSLRGFSVSLPLIGVGRTHDVTVLLDGPAPSGGATFDVVILDPGVATLGAPTLVVAAGQSSGVVQITGQSEASTSLVIDGSADGYESKSIPLYATNDLVDLPPSADLAMGVATEVLVLIAPDPAPPGGATISLVSADPAIVEVLTPTVVVAEGQLDGFAEVRALVEGQSTTVTASLQGYAPDVMAVTTAGALNIVESFSAFGESETDEVYLRLQDPVDPLPAPAGGVVVSLSSADPDCVGVPASATIPAGDIYETFQLSYGGVTPTPCATTVSASSAEFGSDTVEVSIAAPPDLGAITVASLSGTTRVGAGLQNHYRATLAGDSHGGVTVQIESTDPMLALVSPDSTTPGTPVIEVDVAAGSALVDFYVHGVNAAAGSTTVTARQARFSEGSAAAEVETPVLDLLGLLTSYNVSSVSTISPDDFYARSGIRDVTGTAFGVEQSVSATAGELSVTVTSSEPTIADLLTPLAQGANVTVSIPAGGSRTPSSYGAGGVRALYDPPTDGVTTIAVAAAGFDNAFTTASETVTVTVTQATIALSDLSGIGRVGAGLQQQYRATLSGGDHGGVTVRVTSDAPTVATVAPDATTGGSSFVDLVFADSETVKNFYVQGVAGTSGSATLTATGPGFVEDTLGLDVETPVLDLLGLSSSHTITSVQSIADDPFQARVGLRNGAGTDIQYEQAVSAAVGPLTVTFTSDDTAVGQVQDSGGSGDSASAEIAVNNSRSPGSVATGGVALQFDPTETGATTVTASSAITEAGFLSEAATVSVTVNPATMTLTDLSGIGRVGAGLQQQYRVTLSGGEHGGVTVRVTSDTPGVATIAPDATTPGTAFVDLAFADLETMKNFYVQGVAGATGSAVLTATATGFTNATIGVDTETPVIDVLGLGLSHTITSVQSIADDPFQARIGLRNGAGTAIQYEQALSAAVGPLTVSFASNNTAVGQVKDASASGASATAEIAVNGTRTPGSVATGGVALQFDPTETGTTTVTATSAISENGFPSESETVEVTVNPATMALSDLSGIGRVGAGLQQQYRVTLSGGEHGGVTVRVTSDAPGVATVAPDAATAGSAFVDLVFADLETTKNFYVQGVAGTTGSASLTATAVGFTNDTISLDTETPVIDVLGLSGSHTITAVESIPDDPFQARIGLRNGAGTAIQYEQALSAAVAPLTVTFTSDDTAVGQVKDSGGSGASATAEIAANASRTPGSVASGGVALQFTPTETGATTVTATSTISETGFPSESETVAVTVNPATMTLSDLGGTGRVGAGLQQQYRVTLSGSEHGGVTVRVAGGDPDTLRIAPDATTAGTSFIDIDFLDGETTKNFYVQGVLGATGTVTTTATAPGFTNATIDTDVETPVLDILGLALTQSAGGADDPFQVRTGLTNAAFTSFEVEQAVSAGAAPMTVTVTSATPAVGQLVTSAATGASVTVDIGANASRSAGSVATGGVAFDPLAQGSSDIGASATGFAAFLTDTDTVTVNP